MSLPDLRTLNDLLLFPNSRERVREVIDQFDRIGIAFSGAEDIMLVDLAVKARKDVCVYPGYRASVSGNPIVSGARNATMGSRLKFFFSRSR